MSDVTEEPPVGSVVQDHDGGVWQRGQSGRWGLACNWRQDETWESVRSGAPLTLLQPVPEPPADDLVVGWTQEMYETARRNMASRSAPPVDPDTDPLAELRAKVAMVDDDLSRSIGSLLPRLVAVERKAEKALLLAEEANVAAQALEQAADAPTEPSVVDRMDLRHGDRYIPGTPVADPDADIPLRPTEDTEPSTDTAWYPNRGGPGPYVIPVRNTPAAGPSPEVQAVVEAAKAWRSGPGRFLHANPSGSVSQRLAARVDALLAKEATT